MTTPRTAAIIPNYNGAAFLRPCIEALLAQGYNRLDIIVVDNASTDNSLDILAEFPSVTVIRMQTNTGFGTAVNVGIRATGNPYIALVNNDAIVQPGWLDALEAFLDATPQAAAAAPKVIFATAGNIIDSCGDLCTPYGFPRKRGHFDTDTGQYDTTAEVFSVSAVATIFRRDMFDSIGFFDENFFAYYEDVELGLRARLAGWQFYCVPSATTLHRYSATSGRQVKLGLEEVYIHLTGMMLKTAPTALLLRHLPSVLLFHSAIIAGVAIARLRRRSRLPKVPVTRFIPAMLAQRKATQKLRVISISQLESAMIRDSVLRTLATRILKAAGFRIN